MISGVEKNYVAAFAALSALLLPWILLWLGTQAKITLPRLPNTIEIMSLAVGYWDRIKKL